MLLNFDQGTSGMLKPPSEALTAEMSQEVSQQTRTTAAPSTKHKRECLIETYIQVDQVLGRCSCINAAKKSWNIVCRRTKLKTDK